MKQVFCPVFFSLLLLSKLSFAQDDQDELRNTRQLMTAVALMYNGRFNEALPVISRMADSVRLLIEKNPDQKNLYQMLLDKKAFIYESKGDFSTAEQLYRQALAAVDTQTMDNGDGDRIRRLSSLVRIYEKTGNDYSLQESLEELVLLQYASGKKMMDEKEHFFYMYMKMFAGMDTASAAQKEAFYQYIGAGEESDEDTTSTSASPSDSSRMQKAIDVLWKRYLVTKDDPDTDKTALNLMKSVFMLMSADSTMNTIHPPLKDLLRQGKLKIVTPRMGLSISDPWSEVQKLFLVYKKEKNYVAAESLMKEAISADERLSGAGVSGQRNDLVKALFTPEVAKYMNGNLSGNILTDFMHQGSTLNDKHGNIDIAYVQNKAMLAELYREMGRKEEYRLLADTVYLLCKRIDTIVHPMLTNAIAAVYVQIERDNDAELQYRKLVRFFSESTTENYVSAKIYQDAMQQLVRMYKSTGRYKEAKSTLEVSLAYDKKIGAEKYLDHFQRLTTAAELYEAMNEPELAAKYCSMVLDPLINNIRDNFSFLSESEKMSFLNNQTAAFDLSASLMATNKQSSEAFIIQTYNRQLELKGLVLNDEKKILAHIHRKGTPTLKQLLNDWQDTRATIAWEYSQPACATTDYAIDSLNRIANEQEKKLSQLSYDFVNNRKNREIGFPDIQRQLKPGAAAIEFIRFKYYRKDWTDSVKYAAFVTLPDHAVPYFIPLCGEGDLAAILGGGSINKKQFIDTLYGNGLNPDKNTISARKSDRLYRLVWAPLEPYLKNTREVAISPAGLLCRINFDALPYDSQHYLIDQYDIREFNNIQELATKTLQPENAHPTDAVLFGNIDYGVVNNGFRWPSLSTTGMEVNQIGNLLEKSKCVTTILTGNKATEERIRLLSGHSPEVLHIATHGFSKPAASLSSGPRLTQADNPMFRSGIVMAGANKVWSGALPVEGEEDGIVTAYEIAGLDLSSTRLVVLSACETALGDILNSEGVFGLQRGFKLAGAGDLVLGLWSLPGEETTQLMSNFYRYKVSAEKYSYSAAFHSAQKELRNHQSPYHWAGMIFIE